MGAVYEGLHIALGRAFAVKVLHAKWASNREVTERFHREAQSAAGLGHPGIVRVTDHGCDEESMPYLVMELLTGANLCELPTTALLPWEWAVDVAVQALDALGAAHKQSIIHRDLKPSNLFLSTTTDGVARIMLLDFGLAKVTLPPRSAPLTPLTHGTVIGTLEYMSPEQAEDPAGVDPRTDVYSLGATLFHLLTGQPPVAGLPVQVLCRVAIGEVQRNPRSLRPDLPAALDAIVERAMAARPEDRFASAGEMRAALELTLRALPQARLELRPLWQQQALQGTHADAQALLPTRNADTTPSSRSRAMLALFAIPFLLCVGALGPMLRRTLMAPKAASKTVFSAGASGLAQEIPPTVPPGMVFLRGGPFFIGSTLEEIRDAYLSCVAVGDDMCRAEIYLREGPSHLVVLQPFFLDLTEVTNLRFLNWLIEQRRYLHIEKGVDGKQVVSDLHGTRLLTLGGGSDGIEYQGGRFALRDGYATHPVVHVTWYGATAFCAHYGKQLPTEAEWEFAARGAARRRFPWGDRAPRCEDVVFGRALGKECASYARSAAERAPQAVGSSPPDRTPEGVLDLGGNVMEWVQDSYLTRINGYPACTGPCQAVTEESGFRVLRGGSFVQDSYACRGAGRSRGEPDEAKANVGFRCASLAPSAPVP